MMVKLFQTPDNPEDHQQHLLDTIDRYHDADSLKGKLQLFVSIAKMADRDYVGAYYL